CVKCSIWSASNEQSSSATPGAAPWQRALRSIIPIAPRRWPCWPRRSIHTPIPRPRFIRCSRSRYWDGSMLEPWRCRSALCSLPPLLVSPSPPHSPPRVYPKRPAARLLLRPATFLANSRDMADLKNHLEPQLPRYRELSIPTLVMSGSSDFVVAPQLHAVPFATGVPHAQLVILPGIGHMLHHVATDRVLAEIEALAAMMAAPNN